MNRKGKSWPLFVVAILIVLFSLTAILGVSYTYGDTKNVYVKGASDIRFGIDIRGGVDVTFMPADDVEATEAQMTAAKTVIEDRLVGLGITDYESYVDNNKNRIIVRFPWKNDEADFNPQTAIDEIGTTAKMVFRKGSSATGEEILSGDDVASASAAYNETEGWVVQLKFNSAGASAFATATTELATSNGTISIWLDDNNISTATVNEAITGGEAIIKGNFDQDSASTLANQINSGSLPFALSAESYSTISPSLGAKSLDVMVQAGIIAFILVAILMIVRYRLPGTIAVISLMGQAAATLAVVSPLVQLSQQPLLLHLQCLNTRFHIHIIKRYIFRRFVGISNGTDFAHLIQKGIQLGRWNPNRHRSIAVGRILDRTAADRGAL